MGALNLKIENKIAIVEFDQPDSKVNVLNRDAMEELSKIIEALSHKSKSELIALIILSKKEGIFIAGADIKELQSITSCDEAQKMADLGKDIFDRLIGLDLITIAAINGVCLGGGLELALACKYRVASFSDSVKIGLPEVRLGVIPGWAGTQRLPKVVGLTQALNMILPAKILSGKQALKCGLVSRLFPEPTLIKDCIDFVHDILDGKAQLKRKKKKLFQVFLEDTVLGRAVLFNQAKKNVLKKTKGFYPAPLKALEVIKRTYGGDIKKGSLVESKAFGELVITDVSKNLIKVFYLNEEFKKFPWVDETIKPASINKCGVVGAGIMGGGIAQLLSYKDVPTRVKDINYGALKTALKTANKLFSYALKKRKLKRHQVEYKLGLISPTLTYKGFSNADIVIEAVVEDLGIKQKVFGELDKLTSPKTILASNTSSLPIIKIGEGAASPERVVGLHFFNPVHRMPLVEVIRSDKTSDETVARTVAFARGIGKFVIVVKDVPGFLINRILLSYLNEAGFLLEGGMKIDHIDRVALNFGMPMGPLELIDEIGIDVGYKVAKILESSYGPRMKVCSILEKVREKGLLGKKTKCGFYLHRGKKKKIPNPEIYNLIGSSRQRPISSDKALKRMVYIMINEAARCLEEKVVDRPGVVDIGMIMGTGFPPFRAGLLQYADSVGIDNIAGELKAFEKELAQERFRPCNYLLNKV